MRDRISSNTINFGCRIHLINAVCGAQFLSCDLPGSSLLAGGNGGEGKFASGAHTEHPADDALFTHTDSDQGSVVSMLLQELHQRNVVVQRSGCTDDLVKIRRVGGHLRQSLIEFLRCLEIMK